MKFNKAKALEEFNNSIRQNNGMIRTIDFTALKYNNWLAEQVECPNADSLAECTYDCEKCGGNNTISRAEVFLE